MKRFTASLLLALATCSTLAEAATLPSDAHDLAPLDSKATLRVAPLDHAKALAEDAAAPAGPLRYAVPHKVAAGYAKGGKPSGRWDTLPDGRELWRLDVRAPGALSVDLGLDRMFLPQGAELYLANADRTFVLGPYTDADNTRSGVFYTPLVPGELMHLELVVPAALREHVHLELGKVHSAYRDIWSGSSPYAKSGSCNVDSVCPQGDPIRNQIRAEGRYTFSGALCSGQLVNNTTNDRKRYFSTANHCVSTQADANSVVVYWRYESPTCRTPGSAASGTPIPVAGNSISQTGGAVLRATSEPSDFTLLELNTAIPAGADPYWDGWDRREIAPTSASVVHHPSGDEKRIAFENDPLVISDLDIPSIPGSRHWQVNDWDLGTTEQGSSGSGLLNQNRLLVGVLSGGAAACGNDSFDRFGRLSVAWEGGGSASSRLRDWLDPTGSAAQTIQGTGGCNAPTITLNGPATGLAGEPITFSLTASGAGPFTVAWDVDGDGTVDRTQAGVANTAQVSPSYPTAFSTNVGVTVTDTTGCAGTAQRALNVSGPDIVASALPLQQVCGDFDAVIEPGERWSQPVRLFNAGGKALDGAYAIFTEGTSAAAAPSDSFGYRVVDNSNAACPFNFVDITSSAAQTLIAAGNDASVTAQDDGHTNPIVLSSPFNFYGASVSSIVMSTNGYLSTSASDSGGDYDNTCSLLPPDRGSSGGRLNVLHDDFVVGAAGGLRTRSFLNCPRPADSGPATTGCTVFQWTGLAPFGGSGNAEFQAILYDGTWEIVYQYRTADSVNGADATISIQNPAVTDRLQYACNEPRASAGSAVCQFHPSALPGSFARADIRVERPAAPLSNLQSGQEQTVDVPFLVPANAACGSSVALDYVGTVDNVAYSMRAGNVLTATIGNGGACNVSTCPGSPTPFASKDGFFANPSRFGNGIGAFNIPSGNDTVFFGLWFTGQTNRLPTWYAIQGIREGDQAVAPLYRFDQVSTNPFAVSSSIVGQSQVTYVGPEEYVFTWVLDGVRGGEQQVSLYPRSPNPVPNRTGAWFNPGESGWGTAYDDHLLGGVPDQVGINYLYGGDGTARWTLGQSSNLEGGPMPQNTYLVHCPTCPNFADFINFPLGAGTLTRTFTSLTTGTVSTNIVFPAPLSGTWVRNNLPIQMLTAPVPQGP